MTVQFETLTLHDRVLLDYAGCVFEAFIIYIAADGHHATFWYYDHTTSEYVTAVFTADGLAFRALLGRPLITHVWDNGWSVMKYWYIAS